MRKLIGNMSCCAAFLQHDGAPKRCFGHDFRALYRISEEELTWLGEQVEELGRVVHAVCSERIAELEAAAK